MSLTDVLQSQKPLLYSLLYGTLVGIQSNIAKLLIPTFEASYIVFLRCFPLIFVMPLVEWNETNNCTGIDLVLYIASCITTFIPFGTMICSFKFMGVGDSNAIEFGGALIMTGVIGHVALNERISFPYFVLLLVSCAGVTMVARPTFIFGERGREGGTMRELGALLAFSGSFFLGVWPVLIRKIKYRQTLYCFAMTTVLGLIGMILAGIWCTIESSWTIPTTWIEGVLVLLYGLSNIFQMVAGLKLLEIAVATDYTISTTLSTVISYVLQIAFFDEEANVVAILGVFIVITCIFVSAFWEYLGSKGREWFGSEEVEALLSDDEDE